MDRVRAERAVRITARFADLRPFVLFSGHRDCSSPGPRHIGSSCIRQFRGERNRPMGLARPANLVFVPAATGGSLVALSVQVSGE